MKSTITALLLLIATQGFSQNFLLDIHKNKLADCIAFEEKLGSKRIENKSTHIVQNGVAQPIEYRREEKGLPDVIAYYFFYKKDSAINYLMYEWDETNFTDYKLIPKQTHEQINLFIDKYQELYNLVRATYGKSKSEGDAYFTSKIESEGLKKKDTWKTKDRSEIQLSIALSNKYEKNEAVTVVGTHRIRMYIADIAEKTNEKKSKITTPDETKVKELDAVFKTFLWNLKDKKFEEAKLSLSPAVTDRITVDILATLSPNIRFNDSLIIYIAGMQVTTEGINRLMVQYKYASDFDTPPKDLVKVLFDEQNKITGIQPIKRN